MPSPPVPGFLAAWQPLETLACALEDIGLGQLAAERPRGPHGPPPEWLPLAERLPVALEDARTFPLGLVPTEWRLLWWVALSTSRSTLVRWLRVSTSCG